MLSLLSHGLQIGFLFSAMKEYAEELATCLPYTLKVKHGMIKGTVQAENTCDEGKSAYHWGRIMR